MIKPLYRALLCAGMVIGSLPPAAGAQRVPGTGLTRNWQRAEARYRNDVLQEIQPRLERWQAAWNAGAIDELADLYTDDARLLFGAEPVVGKDGIRQYFEEVGASVYGMALSLSDFYVSDRLAFLMGTYTYTVRSEVSTERRVESVFVASFKGHGSKWHIRTHMFREPFPG